MKLKIKRWDLQKHYSEKPASITLLLGKRGSGKSTMLRAIARAYSSSGKVALAIGMSPTHESNSCLDFCQDTLIYDSFREDVFERVVAHQRSCLRKNQPLKTVIFFLDDCAYDKSLFTSKTMRMIFYNSRHYKIGLVLALQYCIDAPVAFRSNTDVVISMREPQLSNRKRLWEQYFGSFDTFQQFNAVMGMATRDYSCLVGCNNGICSSDIADTVFHYKAQVIESPFKLGDTAVAVCDQRCYKDPAQEERDDEMQSNYIKMAGNDGRTVAARPFAA